jgi:hypothetical protein
MKNFPRKGKWLILLQQVGHRAFPSVVARTQITIGVVYAAARFPNHGRYRLIARTAMGMSRPRIRKLSGLASLAAAAWVYASVQSALEVPLDALTTILRVREIWQARLAPICQARWLLARRVWAVRFLSVCLRCGACTGKRVVAGRRACQHRLASR